MKKWNMIIDVAECTNCNLCTLATMDEYVGNDWPGYSTPMPKHGHKWINILQKERGQVGQSPMIDIAYVPTMCNHCDDAPCVAKGGDAVTKRDDGIVLIDPDKAKGRKDLVDACPYGHIWWNEEHQVPQALDVRRPSHRPGLAADARPPVVPDRRHARDQGRGRGDGAHGARGGPRSDAARSSAPSRASTTATSGAIRNASSAARSRRRRTASSIASRARACGCCATARWSRSRRATTTATSNSTSSTRIPAPMSSRSTPGRQEEDGRGQARRQRQSRRDQAVDSCRHSGRGHSASTRATRYGRPSAYP